MEAFAFYLVKSTVWLSGFALVYALLLRNERFFSLNRIFLVSGMLISIIFPLFTWHYTVVIPVIPSVEISEPQIQGTVIPEESFSAQSILLFFYLSGITFLIYKLFKQTLPVLKVIRKSDARHVKSIKLIRTDEYSASFSFISYVFVNPSIGEIETNEIVNHEREHIRQKHWIDLLLFEILRTLQWFNPVVWLYGRLIRQNHEYLADEQALQRSSNPAVYRAALLNQMFGGPVISLANSFNYSLNKKRFAMMKHTIQSPFRKLKLLIVLPMIAGVFYAFAAPEYQFVKTETNTTIQDEKTVNGKVISEDGSPLKSASVIVSGKTIGTITDSEGRFVLKLTDDSPLVISYVGFESQKVSPDFEKEMLVTLKTMVVGIDAMGNDVSATKKQSSAEPGLIIIDGKESSKAVMSSINPEKIENVAILKDQMAVEKYGKKRKDGVIEITLKNDLNGSNDKSFKVQTDKPLKIGGSSGPNQPLIVVDGKITENKDISNIDPNTIESIDVLKGTSASAMYGEKGENGVVLINLKNGESVLQNRTTEKAVVIGYSKDLKAKQLDGSGFGSLNKNNGGYSFNEAKPLIMVNGFISENQSIDKFDPATLKSVSVLKNAAAIEKYGDLGKNGAIEITTKSSNDKFFIVEDMPEFPGGQLALREFIAREIKYPTEALKKGISGKVFVNFVIGKDGSVTDAKVARSVDPSLDKESLRIVNNMPRWKPGSQAGEPVMVSYTVPIAFKLPAEKISKEALKTKSADLTLQKNKLIIVPNPTKDKATITLDGSDSKSKLTVSVFDTNGNLLKKEKKTGPTFTMSFGGFTSGIYLIVANDGNNQFSGQLVVNH
ncbi:MAG: TonB family protein [Prolixibacteraceae bacterium]|jgi:TonB family protein